MVCLLTPLAASADNFTAEELRDFLASELSAINSLEYRYVYVLRDLDPADEGRVVGEKWSDCLFRFSEENRYSDMTTRGAGAERVRDIRSEYKGVASRLYQVGDLHTSGQIGMPLPEAAELDSLLHPLTTFGEFRRRSFDERFAGGNLRIEPGDREGVVVLVHIDEETDQRTDIYVDDLFRIRKIDWGTQFSGSVAQRLEELGLSRSEAFNIRHSIEFLEYVRMDDVNIPVSVTKTWYGRDKDHDLPRGTLPIVKLGLRRIC